MDPEDRFPPIPEELLKELQRRFPHKSPQLNETERGLLWRGGQRSVVDLLEWQFNEQNERALHVR